MNPNHLPKPSEVQDASVGAPSYADCNTALCEAIVAAEILLGHAIRPRRLTVEGLHLGGLHRWVFLPWCPIRDLTLNGSAPGRGFWIEADAGVIGGGMGVPPSGYDVEFGVGFEPGEVPALVVALVELLTRHGLGEETDASEITALAQAGRAMWQHGLEARAEYAAKTAVAYVPVGVH